MIKAIFFDLDGTLLPLNEDEFTKTYFELLCRRLVVRGYDPEELVKVIWAGTKAMYQNDGNVKNEEVFWKTFKDYYGDEKMNDKEYIDDFYLNEFKETLKCCKPNHYALDIIKYCHDNNLLVVLSTNPIFPKIATLTRAGYVGLKEEDFDFITCYENFNYCKPNPMYFKTLLNKFNLDASEVLVFGNNTYEDGDCAHSCGVKCYMVGDYLIESPKAKYQYEHIEMSKVIDVIKEHCENNKSFK